MVGHAPSSELMSDTEGPPPGAPWDRPIADASLAFVDLEMTGLSLERDRVLEVCVKRFDGGREVRTLSSLVRPECGTHGNEHVHGIGREHVENAPTFAELADAILGVLEGAIVVAHGAYWDVRFLEAELARTARPTRFPHYLDSLTLARRTFPSRSHGLSALCEGLGLSARPSHRAGKDVEALVALWEQLVRSLAPRTPRDLWHVRVGERRARPEILATALLAAQSQVPMLMRYRPSRRAAEEHTVVVTAVRTDLDPPRVLGYLVASRSRREFRADRILSLDPSLDPGAAPRAGSPDHRRTPTRP
jgi:DNA polymerase-3 subunit epsilon